MLILALAAALGLQAGPAVDSLAIYAALLREVRMEHPDLPVVLAETRSGVACMPHCGARVRDPGSPAPEPPSDAPAHEHSAELLRHLRERGLIDATCEVPENTFGCPDRRGHVFVGLGEIQERPARGPRPVEDGVWVKLAILVPCRIDCPTRRPDEPYFPDGFGYWSLFQRQADGSWKMTQRVPAFFL